MTESDNRKNQLAEISIENFCCFLTESMGCAMIVTDKDNNIFYANPEAERLFKYSRDDLIGMHVTSLIPGYIDDTVELLTENHTLNDVVMTGIRSRGTRISLDSDVTKAVWKDNPIHVIMLHNISEFRALESEFEAIFEYVPAMVYLSDRENRIVRINKKGARLLGMEPEEIVGRNVAEIMCPEGTEKFIADARDILEKGEPKLEVIETVHTPTGETRWLQTYKVPYRNQFGRITGIAGFIIDVTKLKQTEEALKEAESKYRFIVENTLVGVYILLENGQLAYVNPRLAEIFGYTQEEIINKMNVLELIAPESRELISRNVTERLSGEVPRARYTFKGLRKDGSIIVVEILSTLTTYNGKPAVIGSILDITERVEAQRRRKELEEHKREFYRRTILAATEGKLVITDPREIIDISGETLGEWQICSSEDMSAIRSEISKIAESEGMDESRVYDFVLSIGEAITNVVKHVGSGKISLHRQEDGLLAVISDKGTGIDALELPDLALTRGYTTAVSLGMGYKAMISLADTVYLATGSYGTIVALNMKFHMEEKPFIPGLGTYLSA